MKNNVRNSLLLLLASSLLLPSCQGHSEASSSAPASSNTSASSSLVETGEYFVKDSASDYSIVLPSSHDANLSFAASELQNFVNLATGVTLPIITDDGLSYVANEKHFSLGATSLYSASALEIPSSLLNTGYILKRRENTLFINANQGTGIIDGVYDFLETTINLKIYSYDEFDYSKVTSIPLYDFQVEFKPLFDARDILYKHLLTSSLYRRRMRLYSELGTGKWAAFSHTVISYFLPTSTYFKDHPDWYSSDGTQVCYSNDEMRAEMVEQIKSYIVGHPDATYIQIGHEDNFNMCMCDKCVAARKALGGYGGQELDFTNKIEAAVDPWLKANYPSRSMKYVFFAYQTSEKPPLKTTTDAEGNENYVTDAQGNYVSFVDNLVINPNVMVMYAMIDLNYNLPITDPVNAPQYLALKGWGDIFRAAGRSDGLYIWAYSIPCYGLMIPMNNFGAFESQYHTMADLGASCILDQAAFQSGIPCFEALKIYLQSSLMYKRDLDYNVLIQDFISHYYGPAGASMMEFYNLLMSYYAYLTATKNFSGRIFEDLYEKRFWNYGILNQFLQKMEAGIAAISSLKANDASRYELLESRLRREECFPIYMIFLLFMNDLSQSQKETYWEILSTYTKKYDIIASRESSYDMESMVENWRLQIFA